MGTCVGSSPSEALTLDTVCGAAIVGRPVWIEVHVMSPSGQIAFESKEWGKN